MSSVPFSKGDLIALKQWDTPTICNGLEILQPERQGYGYTVRPMVAADRSLPPIVGLARTGQIMARQRPIGQTPAPEDWYDYVSNAELPALAVIQDMDQPSGHGAFWGEVQSTVHLALGVEGCITNGSFRDVTMLAPGFQILGGSIGPSHAFVHLTKIDCDVDIFGMHVQPNDVIHADFHGAVVIPHDAVSQLPEAIRLVQRREEVILEMARAEHFTSSKMREALSRFREIH